MRSPVVLALITGVALVAGAACRGTAPQASTPPAAPGDPATFTGTVAEALNSGGYTYARLQAAGKEDVWIAATEFQAATGERLTVDLEMPVRDFESKTMNRTFPLVYFVSHVGRDGEAGAGAAPRSGAPPLMTSRDAAGAATPVEPIAPPPGGMSIADVWEKRTALAGKDVTVRGRVVKVNNQILGRNWIHLQDGSGSPGDGTNDLTVTTDIEVEPGETITVTGVLAVGKDFSAGYVYDVILEQAKVIR